MQPIWSNSVMTASMCENIGLTFFVVAVYNVYCKEIYDVTTIYHVGEIFDFTSEKHTVKGHLLSNARGFPVKYGNLITDDPITEYQFPNCRFNDCSWDTQGWDWKLEDSLIYPVTFEAVTSDLTFSKTFLLPSTISIKMNGYDTIGEDKCMNIFLLPRKSSLLRKLAYFYVMKVYQRKERNHRYRSYYEQTYRYESNIKLYNCTSGDSGDSFFDYDGTIFDVSCIYIQGSSDLGWDFSNGYNKYLIANISSESIQIWNDKSHQNLKLDGKHLFMDIKYACISNPIAMRGTIQTQVLTPSTGSRLISPWFTASTNELCVAIAAHEFGIFNVSAEDISFNAFILESATSNPKGVIQFSAPIPEEIKGQNIRLVLEIFNNTSDFVIEKISSCADEGEMFVLNLDDVSAKHSMSVFDVATQDDAVGWCFNRNVSNGGCERDSLTACPVGFTGYQCETACGRNSYGKHCTGICSKHSQECKGLLLCTMALGCACAPGFFGETCEEECSLGYYGNNCTQTCGHCADRYACDKYTGHCELCESGYYPPYCKDTYPVVKQPPAVVSRKFGEAEVNPFLHPYSGKGTPVMYQVQYRESKTGEFEWIPYETNPISATKEEDTTTIIGDLEIGKFYDVRVILFAENLLNKDYDVPYKTFLSLCIVPNEVDYQITSQSTSNTITISWQYKNENEHWCPLQHYEINSKEVIQWISKNTTNTYYVLSDLLPDSVVSFKLRAYTSGGYAPFSRIFSVSTKRAAPGSVKHLSVKQSDSHDTCISWSPPDNIGSENITYNLHYKCVQRVACRRECNPNDSNSTVLYTANETLDSLLPFTQYRITVAALGGPKSKIKFVTKSAEPTEIVKASNPPFIATNISAAVYWTPVDVCSGFFKGYNYQVYKIDKALETKKLKEAFTRKTYFSLEALSPQTEYFAHIFVKTVAGWNSEKYLRINFTTLATVPDKVVNLTVYKKGRNLLGLRWEKPVKLYGELKSFTISYANTTQSIPPTPCIAWPDLYCYTVEHLKPNKNYTVSIAARNKELSQDGDFASVTAVTRESIPGPPEDFRVLNHTSTTFALSWKYPTLANGIVRSFLLSVEETEQFNSDECCQIYPMQEEVVTNELAEYVIALSSLHPASTYTVSLSAKTVSIGPSQTLTVYTRPPPLLVPLPSVSVNSVDPVTWLQQTVGNDSHIYQPLVKGRMLLVVLTKSSSQDFESGIEDEQLKMEMKKQIHSDFYLAAEYLETDSVTIGSGESGQTKWGTSTNPCLTPGESYRLAAVQVTEYCSVINLDIVFTDTFIAQ